MALPEIDQVKDAALKYDKKALAKMVQMGQLSPTIATMAAMMRDRIVQSEMKPPEQATVVEEVFQPAQGAGLAAVPTNPQMFQGMASGGIVAMAGGGDVPRYQAGGLGMDEYGVADYQQPRGNIFSALNPFRSSEINRDLELRKLGYTTQQINAMSPETQDMVISKKLTPSAASDTGAPPAAATSTAPAVKPPAAPAPPVAPPAGLPAAAAAARPTAPSGLAAAQADYEKTLETQRGEKPTAEGVLADIRKFDKEFGVDREFFKKQAAALEAQREELKGDRKEAANMRLLEAGLSILGGTSPYAFENIGKGASKALAGFADDIKDIKKQTRDLDKARQEYALAQQNAARSDSAKAQQMLEKRADKYNSLGLELAKTRAEFAARMKELGIREEGVRVQREQLNKTPSEIQLIERYKNDPEFRKAFDAMQTARQAPKTEQALREKYAENPWLKKQYPTVEDYIRANTSSAVPGVKYIGTRPE